MELELLLVEPEPNFEPISQTFLEPEPSRAWQLLSRACGTFLPDPQALRYLKPVNPILRENAENEAKMLQFYFLRIAIS